MSRSRPPLTEPGTHESQATFALRHLDRAFQKAGEELSTDWVSRGDPDLASLRAEGSRNWLLLLERHRQPAAGKHAGRRSFKEDYRFVEVTQLYGYPERPWGNPWRRGAAWLIAALLAFLAALAGLVALIVTGADTRLVVLATVAAAGALAARRASVRLNEAAQISTATGDRESPGG